MNDVYEYAREKKMLITEDGYVISKYEFSKIVHCLYFDAIEKSIREKVPFELFKGMFCYPVTTLCTRYIPKRNRKAVENGLPLNIDVKSSGFKFSFLFLSTPKTYRGFKFTAAKNKIKSIILDELSRGEKFLDITMNEKIDYAPKMK